LPSLAELRRLPAGLPAGKTLVTLALSDEASQFHLTGGDPLNLRTSATTASIGVQHGIGNGASLQASLSTGRQSAALGVPNGRGLSLGTWRAPGTLQLGFSTPLHVGLPERVSMRGTLTASFENSIYPTSIHGGLEGRIQAGRTGWMASLDVTRVSAGLVIAPGLGVTRSFGRSVEAGAAIVGHTLLDEGEVGADLIIFLDRVLGRSWSIGGFLSRSLVPSQPRSWHFGLSMTFALPNRLR
jgi:hypothetical protein